jgi:hypothetical protein
MRVVITGATGAPRRARVPARRPAELAFPRTTLIAADVAREDLVQVLRDADAVVHLGWLIQPGRD